MCADEMRFHQFRMALLLACSDKPLGMRGLWPPLTKPRKAGSWPAVSFDKRGLKLAVSEGCGGLSFVLHAMRMRDLAAGVSSASIDYCYSTREMLLGPGPNWDPKSWLLQQLPLGLAVRLIGSTPLLAMALREIDRERSPDQSNADATSQKRDPPDRRSHCSCALC